MCGRYTLTDFEDLKEYFVGFEWPEELEPRYNIAPTQEVLAVRNTPEKTVEYLRWGLIPFWAKDESIGNRMINARSETLAEKKSFKRPYRSQRCLILATGFYEWHKEKDGSKTPTIFPSALWGTLRLCGVMGIVDPGGRRRPNRSQLHDHHDII